VEYINPAWYGWFLGLGVSILLFGPAFFLLVNTSIKDGFNKGFFLSLGVCASDFLMVFAIHFGLSDYYEKPIFQFIFGLVAATAMLIWGLKTMNGKYKNFLKDIHFASSKKGSVIKGFMLNILNPFAFIFWTTIVANISGHFDPQESNYQTKILVAVIFTLIGLLTMDTLKAFTFNKVGKFISFRNIFSMNKIIGIIMLGASAYFYWHTFFEVFPLLSVNG